VGDAEDGVPHMFYHGWADPAPMQEGQKMTFPTHIVAVGGIVENEQGEILLVKHTNGEWGCPGGQVEVGENLIDALKREIWEESGVHVSVDKLYWIGSNTAAHEGYGEVKVVPTKVIFNFICSFIDGELRGSDETLEARWVKREHALEMVQPLLRDRFLAYMEFDGSVQYMEYTSRPYELKLKRQV